MSEIIYKEEEINGTLMKVPYVRDEANAIELTNKERVKEILSSYLDEATLEKVINLLDVEQLIT